MIKLIVSDLDGSLLDSKSRLNPEFFEIYRVMKERRILFCVASGRALSSVAEHFESILDEIHVIASNGAMLFQNRKLVASNCLDKEVFNLIYKYSKDYENAFFGFSTLEGLYAITRSDSSYDFVNAHYGKYKRLQSIEDFQGDVYQCGIFDPEDILKIKAEILEKIPDEMKDRARYISSGHTWLDILNSNTNKGHMLHEIQKKHGILPSETVVFGDYDNDLQMFDFSEYGYAMGNAQDIVKQRANRICKSNDENGVIEKIKELLAEF